jgi:acetate kinase
MRILVFNCGSSSLKFDLFELESADADARRIARGMVDEVGPRAKATMTDASGHKTEEAVPVENHAAAALRALEWVRTVNDSSTIDGVAHRIVHGGDSVKAPVVADDRVMRALDDASRFAPLHNPPALATIRAVGENLPGLPVVIVADSAFHSTLPAYARTYPIPREMAARHGIHRFGFHGIGHAWMLERYAAISGIPAEKLNLVTLQLGAGCSAAAIREGRSIDTSMGLTPLEGLMMATRSGDIDPAIFNYLSASEHLPPSEVERILNHESGLAGVSGTSDDMRELEASAGRDQNAALAIEMFCYRVRKYIGAYMAALGRTDAIIFSAGIGEHSDRARAQISSGLERLGIVLDPERNRAANGHEAVISADDSQVKLHVIPLDEELYIARAAARLLNRPRV